MRSLIAAIFVSLAFAAAAAAQSVENRGPPPEQGAECPPDVKGEPPTIGGRSEHLSEKLAESKGVTSARHPASIARCRSLRRAAVGSRSFRRRARPAEIKACSRSELTAEVLTPAREARRCECRSGDPCRLWLPGDEEAGLRVPRHE